MMGGKYRASWLAVSLLSLFFAGFLYSTARADTANFTVDLRFGDTSPSVLELQTFLNSQGYTLSKTGPGSPGNETSCFGSKTEKALSKFQATHGLSSTGFFDLLTRTLINSILGGSSARDPNWQNAATTTGSSTSTTPLWLAFFDAHAPDPGWIPGFGGGSALASTQSSPPDTTAPSVAITAPAGGGTFHGTIALTASASDNVAVQKVQFAVDGANVGSAITSSPYTYNWDSTSLSDGSHTITATAYDTAGNSATSSGVSITTENTAISFSNMQANISTDPIIITDYDVTITWTTNELSNSTVDYGTTAAYGTASSSAAMTMSHTITLLEIPAGNYDYAVVSTNVAGVTATSSNQTFTIDIINPGA